MAPLTSEPDAMRIVLKMSRRKLYYKLSFDIVAYMRSQLLLQRPGEHAGIQESDPPPPYAATQVQMPRNESEPNHRDNSRQSSSNPPSPGLTRLRKAALLHFDSWRSETLGKLKELLSKVDDQNIVDARRRRKESLSVQTEESPLRGEEDLLVFDDVPPACPSRPPNDSKASKELEAFQNLYHPVPTPLTGVPLRDRQEVLSATLLLLLSVGNYSAYSRVFMCHLASALEVLPSMLDAEETAIATTMVETAQKANAEGNPGMSAEAEAQKRREEGRAGRFWKVGLASVAGAAIIGVTGGLAAPVVAAAVGGLMGSVGLGGLASFLGIFWMNGALVGTLFGAFGAKMTGEIVDRYAKDVEDFKFLPLSAEWGEGWARRDRPESRRLRVTVGINGWLENEADVTKPWRVLGDETEVFALRYEMSSLMSLGQQLRELVSSAAWNVVRAEVIKHTVLVTLQSALWPLILLQTASNIDNPFNLARNRSEKAGQVLADALINRVQGERPVTLIGYSLGARVIYSCLRELAARKAFGLVDTVVLIGAPVPSNSEHWQMMRSMVAGKLFNVHSENDFILGFLYRSTSLQLGVAGLQPVGADIEGVEDLDLSEQVQGHLRYPTLIAQILSRCGFTKVKGGDLIIEKEKPPQDEGEIQLRDKDYAQLGTLIDLDGDMGRDSRRRPMLPPRLSEGEANMKFDPSVKDVQEQKSDPRTLKENIMGIRTAANPETTAKKASFSSAPDLLQGSSRGRDFAATEHRSARISHSTMSSRDGNIRNDEVVEQYDEDAVERRDDDLEEDSDDELTMVEPISIEDE